MQPQAVMLEVAPARFDPGMQLVFRFPRKRFARAWLSLWFLRLSLTLFFADIFSCSSVH
jgi:hypothetical protein